MKLEISSENSKEVNSPEFALAFPDISSTRIQKILAACAEHDATKPVPASQVAMAASEDVVIPSNPQNLTRRLTPREVRKILASHDGVDVHALSEGDPHRGILEKAIRDQNYNDNRQTG